MRTDCILHVGCVPWTVQELIVVDQVMLSPYLKELGVPVVPLAAIWAADQEFLARDGLALPIKH